MRKFLRIILWTLGSVFFLLFLVIIAINTRPGKNFIRERAVAFLRDKLKTEVQIGNLDYGLPKMIVLEDVLLKDQVNDTLLSAGKLRVDIAMLQLISGKISIQQVFLEDVYARIHRKQADTVFNFNYVVEAFTSPSVDTVTTTKDSSAPLQMNLDKLVLHNVRFHMDDEAGGLKMAYKVGDLTLTMRELDPEKLVFRVNKLYGNNLDATIIQGASYLPETPDTSTGPLLVSLDAKEINLNNVSYNQQSLTNQFFMDMKVGKLLVHPENIDLTNQSIAIKDFTLGNSAINILMAERSGDLAEKAADTLIDEDVPQTAKWRVSAGKLNLNKVNFAMNNDNEPRLSQGIDYGHLNVQNLALNAQDINYTTDTIVGVIHHLAASEQSGLKIYKLKTRFEYNPRGGTLNDLYLQTSNTILQDYLAVQYPSVEALGKDPGKAQLEVHVNNSVIGLKDVLLFAPQLNEQPFFRKHKNGMIRIAADIQGKLEALNITRLDASGLGNTEVVLNGKIAGLPDANKLSFDLTINKLQSSRNDIETLLPPTALQQVRLPDKFGIAGTVSGSVETYRPNLVIVTTDGNAQVKGLVDISRGTGNERYDVLVKTQSLNIGSILKNPELGKVTAAIKANGTSFDVNNMNATASGTIHRADFNQYTYKAISFEGTIQNKEAIVQLRSDDPNAQLKVDGTASFAGEYPAINAIAMIDSVDLQALHFSDSSLRFHGRAIIDVTALNPDYPDAIISVTDAILATNNKRYSLDSIYLVSRPQSDSGNNIIVHTQLLNAHIWGRTPLTKLGVIIQNHINRHYALNDSSQHASQTAVDIPAGYDLHLTARIKDNPIIQDFIPDLKDMDTISIKGMLQPDQLSLNIHAPFINYMDYQVNDAKVRVQGADSALSYDVAVERVNQNSIDLWFAHVSGNLQSNVLTSDISIGDRDSNQRFRVNASLSQQGGQQELQLRPGLVLNYETWNVNQPNRVVFGKEGFFVENFGIRQGSESIEVNSKSPAFNAPLQASISNFMLSNITEIISSDTLLANGVLGGNVNIVRFHPAPQVTSQLGITSLSILGDTVGDVAINIKNAAANAIDASVAVTGFGNNVSLSGLYYPSAVNGNNFNMQLALNPLSIAAFEGTAQHQITNASGYLRGNIRLTGTTANPSLDGQIRTDQLAMNVTMLGTRFSMPDEQIRFKGTNIILNDFDIRDSAGNTATLNGRMNFQEMNLAMRLRANNWQALGSTPEENKDFYGTLFLTTNMNVNGPIAAPNVDGTLKILKGTNVTVTVPTNEKGFQERRGVVEFVDMSDPESSNVLAVQEKDTVRKLGRVPVGSNVNLNVSTDEEASFSVIIDEGTGDFVRIKGAANINTTVSPDGTLGLAGTYEIQDGFYQFSYNFIRREFRVQPGSTIIFSGDPMDAELNVTAYYEANVPPYELVSRQIEDPGDLVFFKQRLPFQVQMKLTGPLMEPELVFDIVLPSEKNYRVANEVTDVVRARLNQLRNTPSELNKQVFALIILNRFVAEDPFQNGAGSGGAEAIARQSVSRFVSEQLNKFAGGLIAGLDLTLDLQTSEDYTTGERRNRTDLNVGASKRLLNDRLTVNIGNNFQLEGPRSNSTQGASFIPGNIAVDYDLSKDRTYRVRFFRRDEETGELQGNIISTGASFIFQKDYNTIRQLFMSRKKRLKIREERREKRKQREDTTETAKAAMFIRKETSQD